MIETPLLPDLDMDRIFDQIFIGRGTYLDKTRFRLFIQDEKIIIGRYSSIAEDVWISAGGNHRLKLPSTWPFDNWIMGFYNPTRTYKILNKHTEIGSDVWICDRAIIGGGVKIGHGAVIGAGAVVYHDVPPYAVVVGNPAKIVRYRFTHKQRRQLLEISWWNWSPDQIKERLEWFYMPINEFFNNCIKAGLLQRPVGLRQFAAPVLWGKFVKK